MSWWRSWWSWWSTQENESNGLSNKYITNPVVINIGISEYKYKHDDNLCKCFSNFFHAHMCNLPGCEKDIETMNDLWKKVYGFNCVFDNKDQPGLTAAQFWKMLETARGYLNKDKSFDSLIFSFSGHGGENILCAGDYDGRGGGEIKIKDVQDYFCGKNIREDLLGCPKVFISDACRGGNIVVPLKRTKSATASLKASKTIVPKFHPDQDMAFIYSNTSGYASSDSSNGGYLIISFNETLRSDKAKTTEFGTLVKLIGESCNKKTGAKQCVECNNRFTCNVYFTGNNKNKNNSKK